MKLNLFEFSNCLEFLKKLVKLRAEAGQTQAELARAMGCQAAYFSQALRARVDLTEDHMIRLCHYLHLDRAESEYLLLLLRLSRAGSQALREHLEAERLRLQCERSELDRRLSSRKISTDELALFYCASWIPGAVHVATSCPQYRTPEAIAQRFGLRVEEVREFLGKLERFGLVSRKKNAWWHEKGSLHLLKGSPVELMYQASHRLLALRSLPHRDNHDLHYSAVFASNEPALRGLREQLISYIQGMHRKIEPTSSEEVYAMSFDLFRI